MTVAWVPLMTGRAPRRASAFAPRLCQLLRVAPPLPLPPPRRRCRTAARARAASGATRSAARRRAPSRPCSAATPPATTAPGGERGADARSVRPPGASPRPQPRPTRSRRTLAPASARPSTACRRGPRLLAMQLRRPAMHNRPRIARQHRDHRGARRQEVARALNVAAAPASARNSRRASLSQPVHTHRWRRNSTTVTAKKAMNCAWCEGIP